MEKGNISSIFDILESKTYLTNWITGIVISGGLAVLVGTVKDKLTFAAICTAFVTACFLEGLAFLFLAAYGYATFAAMLMSAVVCGGAGVLLLLTLVGVIRRYVQKDLKKIVEDRLGAKGEGNA
jgi:hypothetical protein